MAKSSDKQKWVWAIIIILALALVILFTRSVNNGSNGTGDATLTCVPASCCHSAACVPAGEAPDCSEILCTQECKPGTLDCGQGSCQEVEGKCQAILTN